jgi:predicted AAA+ superfamily ATPase
MVLPGPRQAGRTTLVFSGKKPELPSFVEVKKQQKMPDPHGMFW